MVLSTNNFDYLEIINSNDIHNKWTICNIIPDNFFNKKINILTLMEVKTTCLGRKNDQTTSLTCARIKTDELS